MLDKNSIDEFVNLPDEQMKKRIRDAAVAAGADVEKVEAMLSDTSRLRNIAKTLTPEDAMRIINMIGADKANVIAEHLKKQ